MSPLQLYKHFPYQVSSHPYQDSLIVYTPKTTESYKPAYPSSYKTSLPTLALFVQSALQDRHDDNSLSNPHERRGTNHTDQKDRIGQGRSDTMAQYGP